MRCTPQQTTSQKVERAIRSAIEVARICGNMDAMEEMFGLSADIGRGRPGGSLYMFLGIYININYPFVFVSIMAIPWDGYIYAFVVSIMSCILT